MAEINTGMSASEIAKVAGVAEPKALNSIVRPIGEQDADGYYNSKIIVGLTESVVGNRFGARHNGENAAENADLKAERRGAKLPAVKELDFIVNLKEEEAKIAAGEALWEAHVAEFLGAPSVEAADGVVPQEATGSQAKLERMKGEAAVDLAKMQELARLVGETTVVGAISKIDILNKSHAMLPEQRNEHLNDVYEELAQMTDKKRNKILGKLGLDIKKINLDDPTNEQFDMLSAALTKQAERTSDGSDVKFGKKLRNTLRGWGSDNKVVQKWVDKQIDLDDTEHAVSSEIIANGDNFRALSETHLHFTKLLKRIANREKVNDEIIIEAGNKVGEMRATFSAAETIRQNKELETARTEHAKRVEASHDLVASDLQLKELREFAKGRAELAEATVVALGKTKELNGQRAAMLEQVAKGQLPKEMEDVFGGESYKAVEAFIESNGQKGDVKLVTDFLGKVDALMGEKGKMEGGVEKDVRAEFLRQSTITVDGKSVEVGFVIGVATDREGTWTITTAKKSEGGEPELDSSSTLYLNHEKIKKYAAAVSATEESIEFFKAETEGLAGGAELALSEPAVTQLEAQSYDANSVAESLNTTLEMQRGLLAASLKPVGGAEENFAEALKIMSESQKSVVEDLYSSAYAEAVKNVAEKLGKNPSEVTPAMIAITHVEAMQTAKHAESMINFLANHDALMNEAVESATPELQKIAKKISILQADRAKAMTFESAAMSAIAVEATVEAEKQILASAEQIAINIEAQFVASTPAVLKEKGSKAVREAIASKNVATEAAKLLTENNLADSAALVEGIINSGEFDSGMTNELYRLVESTRDALANLRTDSRSEILRRALNSGKPDIMIGRINQVVESSVAAENQLRAEAAKSGEKGKEFGEMTPAERAAALIKGDVDLDKMIDSAGSLKPEEVDEMFNELKSVRGPEAVNARAEVVTRIFTKVQEALRATGSMEDLRTIMEANPDGWLKMLQFAVDNTGSFTAEITLKEAQVYAEKLIAEKKT